MSTSDWLSGGMIASALAVNEIFRFAYVPSGRILVALVAGATAAIVVAALANRPPLAERARPSRQDRAHPRA